MARSLVSTIIPVKYSKLALPWCLRPGAANGQGSASALTVRGSVRVHGEGDGCPVVEGGSPTVRRRRLAAELRQLREAKGRSGESVANALRWSPSKISRYERAKTGLRPKDVERLLDYYGVHDAHREMLLSLAVDATQKGWWEEYSDSLDEDYQQFIGLEHEATSIAIWHVDVVPGLLQTEGYARQIINSYDRVEPIAPSQVTRLVRVRMRRQQVLERGALNAAVVLDESALLRRIGPDLVMYEQLHRLARECERPNLAIHILPLDGRHTVIGGSFVVFGFGAGSDAVLQDVVSTEQMRSGFILEGERETHLHRVAFRTLTEAALSPAESKQLILDTAESRWTDRCRAAS